MAAPEGNDNKVKNKPWADSLNRAMTRYKDGKENALNIIADQTVKAAINGDVWAITEIGNRLDGKPAQSVEQKTEHSGQVRHSVEMHIIDATPKS